MLIPSGIHAALKKFELFSCGEAPPPHTPLKVGRIRGLRNDGLVHGPWPGTMVVPGPALVHGPWAPAGPMGLAHWARVRPWSMGPGPWPWPGEKTAFTLFLLNTVFTFFLDFISTVPGNVEMKSPPNGGHSISTFPGNFQIE